MAKIFDGDLKVGIADAPELAAISIEKTASGSYNIPFFKANNLSKEEVDEYKKSIKIYAEL
jgi:hypothetical protein